MLGFNQRVLAHAVPPGTRPCFAVERRRFVSRYPFEVPRDRPTEVRYHAARKQYPQEVKNLTRRLVDRPDLDWIRVFLREASYDSSLEFLASLHLLADGAKPGWVPPLLTGFTELPVVDPTNRQVSGHFAYPALYWNERFLFPQVTVSTKGALFRLDLLLGVVLKGQAYWWDIEIDGPGHDSTTDIHRIEQLPLPIHRFSAGQVVNGSFLKGLLDLGRPQVGYV